MVADASRRHVQDHVLAGGADLRTHFVHRESLPGRVARGEAVVRTDDQRVTVVVGEEHRRGVPGDKVSRGLDRAPEPVFEVERRVHLVVGVV